MKYLFYVVGEGEGCDYTIGCGHRVDIVEADTYEEAVSKWKEDEIEMEETEHGDHTSGMTDNEDHFRGSTPKVNYYCKFCNSPVIKTGNDERHGVLYSCTDSDCLTSINLYSRDVISRLEYPDTPEPELGPHYSGMEAEE